MSSQSDRRAASPNLDRAETWDRPPPDAELPDAEVPQPGISTAVKSVIRWLSGGSKSAAPDASGLGSRTSTWSAAPDAGEVSPSDWSSAAVSPGGSNLGERTSTWSTPPDAEPVSTSDWRAVGAQAVLGERTSTWSSAPDAQPISETDWSSPISAATPHTDQGAAPTRSFTPPSRLQASAPEFVPGRLVHLGDVQSAEVPTTSTASSCRVEAAPKTQFTCATVPELEAAGDSTAVPYRAPLERKVSSPHRGRALLRASTVPYTTACDSIESASRPQLRRAQTFDMGGLPAGLVKPTRTASSERKQRKLLRASIEHHAEERSASLPPPVQKPPELSEIPFPSVARAPRRPANITRKASTEMCQEVRAVVQPAKKVFARDVRRQLRLIVAGLMGSGKSTLCRMIAHLLGGVWVNQDEFSHLKKGAKRAFLAEITNVSKDKRVPVLIVDKINTMRQHRTEIVEAMRSGVGGDIVFIQLAHPHDEPGRLDKQMQLCLSRIRGRGDGHRTLMGNDPKLHSILRMTVGGVEAVTPDELELFSAHFSVNMTLVPVESVKQILADLDHEGFLGRFHIDELITQDRLDDAFEVTRSAEQHLKKQDDAGWSTSDGRKGKKPAPLWIWLVDYTDDSKSAIKRLWAEHAHGAPKLELNSDFHTTLLYLGGGSDKEIASRHWQLDSPEEVSNLRQVLQAHEGMDVKVEIRSLVWDGRIAAAEVHGLEGICANMHAHITVALKEGVPPRVSNELLARRDANEDLSPKNLGNWLSQLGLSQYEAQTLEWCSISGAASADEIAENAEDVAAAVEVIDEDQRARTRMMFAQSAPGEVCEAPLAEPLALRGRVRGKRRGE